jgi:hypothetical protein
VHSAATRAAGGQGRTSRAAITSTSVPLNRTMAIAPRPGAVASAMMVSDLPFASSTLFNLEDLAWLDELHCFTLRIIHELATQPIDSIERA